MSAAKIKKGDQVIVLAGRDKGKKGEVFQVMPKEAARWCAASTSCAGISARARRRRAVSSPRRRRCISPTWRWRIPKDGKPTRVGFKMLDDGRKVRVAKRSGEQSFAEKN